MPYKKFRNITETIVKNDMCIGCGVCIGVCPPDVLRSELNKHGEIIAVEYKDGCLDKCTICFDVCPFDDKNNNEDILSGRLYSKQEQVEHNDQVGYYMSAYVGYSLMPKMRNRGSAGGLATWFNYTMLKNHHVDRVISVGYSENKDNYFKYKIVDNADDLLTNSKSKYYPVDLGDMIKIILKDRIDYKYLVVGVPCFIKSLRLAQNKYPKLKRRLTILVGLVCGQQKSTFFTDYLSKLANNNDDNLFKVDFRINDNKDTADNYGHKFYYNKKNGDSYSKNIYWNDGINKAWKHDYFKLNPCNFCDDIFAETADIVFGDAWLPEYKRDYKGHTIMLIRDRSLHQRIGADLHNSSEALINPLNIKDVIKSQQGLLDEKRKGILFRKNIYDKKKKWYPKKRNFNLHINLLDKIKFGLKYKLNHISKVSWGENNNIKYLLHLTWKLSFLLDMIFFIIRLINFVKRRFIKFYTTRLN